MDINDVLIFSRVANAGSFSKAARFLGMPVSTVSRRVAELEKHLGVPLLIRTTRSLKITDVGKAYLEHASTIAAELEKAEALATNLQSIPQGTLKITATADFGNRFLNAIIDEFLKVNPRVQAEVVFTERVVDLIEEGFDLAIRMGELEDSSLVARKLGSMNMQLFASPGFIKKYGEPKTPAQLEKFECLRFSGEDDADHWHLKGPRGETQVRVSGRVISNDLALIRDFAVRGRGIARMPHFFCTDELKAGKLKVILKEWGQTSGPIHVVYPSQRFLLPKVRAFVDHLVKQCETVQWRSVG